MKRVFSIFLATCIFMSVFCGLNFQIASAETLWGIDVSYYQGTIDWNKVKAAGVDFAILRAGYEYTKDTKFEEYYAGAKAAGVPVGAYLYTYADNTDEATKEANTLVNNLKGKTFEWPIYIDVEESSKYSQYTKDYVSNLVLTELQILEAAGYYCGVYTYTYFSKSYINMSLLSNYTTWIAEYSSKCNYTGAYDMWQYSSSLSISGVSSARCDTNYCYVNFEPIIKAGGYNGFEAEDTSSGEPVPVEDMVLIDGESSSSMSVNSSHYATTVEVAEGKSSDDYAIKMNCNDPDSKASSTNVGGMMFYNFPSATDLSAYEYLSMDIYLPQTMTGEHNFQVNFVTSGEDGYNQNNDISGWEAGWHTIVIPLDDVVMEVTASWKNISKLRFTWFNYGQLSDATYFLVDNVVLSQNEPITEPSDTESSDTESSDTIIYVIFGDVDGDSLLTPGDALIVLQSSVGKITLTEEQISVADVDGDNSITSMDALYILQKTIARIDSFPCEEMI